jgi:CheY-like chemotaxis protein
MKTVLYVDDKPQELKKIQQKFLTNSFASTNFNLICVPPPKNQEDFERLFNLKSDVILMDLDLSKPDSDKQKSPFSGLTLSTEIRQRNPDIPIVLFTRKTVFSDEHYSKVESKIPSWVDATIYKNELFIGEEKLLFLMNLAKGFEILRICKIKNFDNLLKVLNSPISDSDSIKMSDLPLNKKTGYLWAVSDVSYWIQQILIEYPGILYDPIHAATFLGISEKEFLSPDIQDFFNHTKYDGLFPPIEGRWWKSAIRETVLKEMTKEESKLPIIKGFVKFWIRTQGRELESSKCIVSNEKPADCVCFIYKKPVALNYSISYHPDSRPDVMDEARVSYKAIKETNDVKEIFLDPVGLDIYKEILKRK